MPRQRSSRPSAPARSSAPAKPQVRQASTVAAPPAAANARPTTGQTTQTADKQPGLLSQMASTAGGVAIGSTIGHGISSMLFGSSGAQENSNQDLAAQNAQSSMNQMQQNAGARCEMQAKDFSKCIEVADFNSCSWYLEQLKACQAAASQY